jgi:hypothetical protein
MIGAWLEGEPMFNLRLRRLSNSPWAVLIFLMIVMILTLAVIFPAASQ